MKLAQPRRKLVEPQLISMVDVVLSLVFFFMMFTTFNLFGEGLNVNLPSAYSVEPQDVTSFVVTVTDDGSLYFNDDLVDVGTLERRVREVVGLNPEVVGIVRGDEAVAYQHIVTAMDVIRTSGVQKVSLAARLKQGDSQR